MEFWGMTADFWTTFVSTTVVFSIAYGGYQLLRKIQKKNWETRLNVFAFGLLLSVSLFLGRWVERWIFS